MKALINACLNWTKVGLKFVNWGFNYKGEKISLNWTKVGLKYVVFDIYTKGMEA